MKKAIIPKQYESLPRVVKFSGGKTSGMMLELLLENGQLDAARGDVVLFNNTAAEHPKTYDFVVRMKERTEAAGLPFFMLEWMTYETQERGRWKRKDSVRMVNGAPFHEEYNPNGFHWQGEVFEEMLSFKNMLPHRKHRICTSILKMDATTYFLNEWLSVAGGLAELGHNNGRSMIDKESAFEAYLRNGGNRTKEDWLNRKAFLWSRPTCRPKQSWGEFSWMQFGYKPPPVADRYVSVVGLRADEPHRVNRMRVCGRDSGAECYVYMPMSTYGYTAADVRAYWKDKPHRLDLGDAGYLSNCTFCFLKSYKNLFRAWQDTEADKGNMLKGTPADIDWWINIEKKYGRNISAYSRNNYGRDFLGFLTEDDGYTYEKMVGDMKNGTGNAVFQDEFDIDCNCTD